MDINRTLLHRIDAEVFFCSLRFVLRDSRPFFFFSLQVLRSKEFVYIVHDLIDYSFVFTIY